MFFLYFNFKEKTFNLAVDLAYLFLSRHLVKAIAHLTYTVSECEGFIAITGEREAGKTIICSSFVEQLDSNDLWHIGQRVSVGYCIGPLT